MTSCNEIMNENDIRMAIDSFADNILKLTNNPDDILLLGIRTRGVILAQRIQKIIEDKSKKTIPMGILDITLYRDDLSTISKQPVVGTTEIPMPVDDKIIILVDDVLYTGRTIRAALDAIIDFGRPRSVKLAILIDRGLREYPIHPDFTGKFVETLADEVIQVRFEEIDGEERVLLLHHSEK